MNTFLILAGIGLLVVALIVLRRKFPDKTHDALAALTDALHNNSAVTRSNTSTVGMAPAPQPAGMSPEQVLEMMRRAVADDRAKRDAGAPMPEPHPLPVTPADPVKPRNPLSNAPAGYPDEQDGYPLFYAIGGDGKPVGAGKLVYDGNPFDTVEQIATYKAAVAMRAMNLAAYQAPAFIGTLPMASLTAADWCYIDSRADLPWSALLSGDADIFRAMTVHFYYSDLAGFNPSTYAGPLKAFG